MKFYAHLTCFTDRIGRLDLEDVTRDTFPLPQLKTKLESIAETLHFGIGFTVLRGLEPRKYSRFDNAIIYLGITSYIAEIRGCQDSSGNMFSELSHLDDLLCLFTHHSTYQRSRSCCPRFRNASITLRQQRSGLSLTHSANYFILS